jgi:threonine dehydratase
MFDAPIQLANIEAAEQRIRPYLAMTPLYEALSLSRAGHPLYAKLEAMNPTGAFKVRGAFNALLALDPAQRQAGVVTASGGSHGLGVAYAARRLDIPADIYLGPDTSPAKRIKIKRLGARIHIVGCNYDDAHHAALQHSQRSGQPYIHAYDDPLVMAGQGTIGLEILSQLPDVATVIVPVGGGGLISGITIAIRTLRPTTRIVAVQPAACPALSRSLADGRVYETYPYAPTIADGLAGGVGHTAVALAQAGQIDDVLVIPEAAIQRAVAWLLREEQWLVEGAAALGVAALLENRVEGDGPVCCVLTGANITTERLTSLLHS